MDLTTQYRENRKERFKTSDMFKVGWVEGAVASIRQGWASAPFPFELFHYQNYKLDDFLIGYGTVIFENLVS